MTQWHRQVRYRSGSRLCPRRGISGRVLQSCLDRLDEINPVLNVVIAQDRAAAKIAASASAVRWRAGTPIGPLDGVPFTVKDNIVTADLPTTWGSPLFRDYRATVDELPVARLRQAGAVLIGKTNVPELTSQGYTDNTLFGPTGNPWDPALTPGGSSGGAVAAVASGIGPVALGTDGGGSIRRPASHAGVVGLKPTPGCIPRCDGLPAILLDFEVIGPVARTIADLTVVTAAISAPDPRDPALRWFPGFAEAAKLAPQRILFVPRFGAHPVDPEIAASVADAARLFAVMGHQVREGDAPFDIEETASIQTTISRAGLAWLMRSMGGTPSAPSSEGRRDSWCVASSGLVVRGARCDHSLAPVHGAVLRDDRPDPDAIGGCVALAEDRDPSAAHRRSASRTARPCGVSPRLPTSPRCLRWRSRAGLRLAGCRSVFSWLARRGPTPRCSHWARNMRQHFPGLTDGLPLRANRRVKHWIRQISGNGQTLIT